MTVDHANSPLHIGQSHWHTAAQMIIISKHLALQSFLTIKPFNVMDHAEKENHVLSQLHYP